MLELVTTAGGLNHFGFQVGDSATHGVLVKIERQTRLVDGRVLALLKCDG